MSTIYFKDPKQESIIKALTSANNEAPESGKETKEQHLARIYLNLSEEFQEIKHIAVLSCN